MSYYILIILCIIVLIAYFFEVTSKFSKIPGVILLMTLGITLKYFISCIGLYVPDFSILLPIMGTLGLVLIVLEGSLDLTINAEKKKLALKSFASAVILLFSSIIIFAIIFHISFKTPIKAALINAVPLGIISSAVAIPSSLSLKNDDREFIIYESSISDIAGILLFNFLLFNQLSIGKGIMLYSFEVLVSIVFSLIFSVGLAYMLHKTSHHVKYVIIITTVVLVYELAELMHWPSLIVVLIFGLVMNNNYLFQNRYTRKYIDFKEFNLNLGSFKQITGELTFIVRSFFFLIFGFYTSINDLLNLKNLINSVLICFSVYLLRALFFRFILHKPFVPLLFFTPRGLITILLFLSIPVSLKLSFINEGLITQVIFITIIVMAIGNVISAKHKKNDLPTINENSL